MPTNQAADEAGVRQLVARRPPRRGTRRAPAARDLGELGRLQLERAEVEAQPGAVAHRAEHDHQHEQHDRDAVEEPRLVFQHVVVDRHHDDHRHDRGDQEDHLAGDEQVRVGELGVRRRVDDEQPMTASAAWASSSTQSMLRLGRAGAGPDVAEAGVRPRCRKRRAIGVSPCCAVVAAEARRRRRRCWARRPVGVDVERVADQHRRPSRVGSDSARNMHLTTGPAALAP